MTTRIAAQVLQLLVICACSPTLATNIRVPEDQPTIKACVAAASPGDTCSVAPGRYSEQPPDPRVVSLTTANVIVDKAIVLKSRELYQAVLDGTGSNADVFLIIQANATIEGFVIQNGNGGAISRQSPGGTGFSWVARNLVIRDVVDVGIGVDEWGPDPPSGQYSSATFNNVVVDHADRCYYTNDANTLDVRNSVASNCRVAFEGCHHQAFDFSYSLVVGVTTVRASLCPSSLPAEGPGFGAADPEFVHVRTASHDFPFFLRCSSPAVDAGDPAASDNDVAFPPSWSGARNDIGAYGGPGADTTLGSSEWQQVMDQLLTVNRSPFDSTVRWCGLPDVDSFDVVKGDMTILRATHGGFEAATAECLADNIAATSVIDSEVPTSGGGYWYLERCDNCPGIGTYDVALPSQMRSRDPGILASGNDCP